MFILFLIFAFFSGVIAMLRCVFSACPHDNPYLVVYGSLTFWLLLCVCLSILFALGVGGLYGWSYALSYVIGGTCAFLGQPPGLVIFTWGRAILDLANKPWVSDRRVLNSVLRRTGVALQNSKGPLDQFYKRHFTW